METPVLDKLLSIAAAAGRRHKMLHAAIWRRPALTAELENVVANYDDYDEEHYELALDAWTYTAMARSDLQFHWEISCGANTND